MGSILGSDNFECYCIKYNEDFMFFDSELTLLEVRNNIFLDNLLFLSHDKISQLKHIEVDLTYPDYSLKQFLSEHNPIVFSSQDLKKLSNINFQLSSKRNTISFEFKLKSGYSISNTILNLPYWNKSDGFINIDIYIQGRGAEYVKLENLNSALKEKKIRKVKEAQEAMEAMLNKVDKQEVSSNDNKLNWKAISSGSIIFMALLKKVWDRYGSLLKMEEIKDNIEERDVYENNSLILA